MPAGRPRKPTQQKIAEGNPGLRPLPKNEVKPEAGVPEAPAWLDREAKAEWRRVAPHLFKAGLLAKIDRAALTAYCQSWSRWVAAEKKLAESSLLGQTKTGKIQRNPYLGIAHQEMNHVWKTLSAFGMTPSSRAGLEATTISEDSENLWKKFAEMSRIKKAGTDK